MSASPLATSRSTAGEKRARTAALERLRGSEPPSNGVVSRRALGDEKLGSAPSRISRFEVLRGRNACGESVWASLGPRNSCCALLALPGVRVRA